MIGTGTSHPRIDRTHAADRDPGRCRKRIGARHHRPDGPSGKLDRTATALDSRGRGSGRQRGDRRRRRGDRRTGACSRNLTPGSARRAMKLAHDGPLVSGGHDHRPLRSPVEPRRQPVRPGRAAGDACPPSVRRMVEAMLYLAGPAASGGACLNGSRPGRWSGRSGGAGGRTGSGQRPWAGSPGRSGPTSAATRSPRW